MLHDDIGVGLDFGFFRMTLGSGARVGARGYAKSGFQELVYKTDLLMMPLYAAQGKKAGNTRSRGLRAVPILWRSLPAGLWARASRKRQTTKRTLRPAFRGTTIHVHQGLNDGREISTYAWARDKNGKPDAQIQDGAMTIY